MDEERTPAAERLLDAAARLFYTRGVSNVGINEIIARAGVARMTLYHHFPGKEALIKAVLERRQAEREAWLERAAASADEPKGRLLALFDLLEEWFSAPDFRGCPLVAATFELGGQLNAARPYAQALHGAVRSFVREQLALAAGTPGGTAEPGGYPGAASSEAAASADLLAEQLLLLLEGAAVVALVSGEQRTQARAARAAAELLLS